jgi:hypothetical protein
MDNNNIKTILANLSIPEMDSDFNARVVAKATERKVGFIDRVRELLSPKIAVAFASIAIAAVIIGAPATSIKDYEADITSELLSDFI